MARTLKKELASKFVEFSKHSTLHGFFYFYKSKSWVVHAIWSFIIISSVLLCSFLCNMILNKYFVNPTLTVVETTHYSMAEITFPAISVCDKEMVYIPNADNVTDILKKRGFTLEQIDEFYNSFTAVKRTNYEPPEYISKMHLLLEDLGLPISVLADMFISKMHLLLEDLGLPICVLADMFISKMHLLLEDLGLPISVLADMLKKPCEVMVAECQWRSKQYNCSDMFRGVFTVVGYCCQFDMTYFKSNIRQDNVTFIAGTHPKDGLQVVVNEQSVSANGTATDGYVLLYIYDEKESITLLNKYVTLTASTFYDVNIDVWLIESSENVNSLPLDVRKCLLSTDKSVGADFYQGCLSILILQEVVRRCRCLPFNYTAKELQVDDHIPCTWRLLFCVYQTIEKKTAEISAISSKGECYERCEYVQYEIEVKYVKTTIRRKFDEYHGKFVVHYDDNTCMKYKRQVLYSWDQMLANLGGIFGLCLGGSIISIIELAWFILDLLFTVASGFRRRRKVISSMENKKIFTTNVKSVKYSRSNKKLAFVN